MRQSGRHSRKRGGIQDTSRGIKQRTVNTKGGIKALVTAKMAGADIPLGNMRSMSTTRIFRQRRKKG
jgi:hypothetical protein